MADRSVVVRLIADTAGYQSGMRAATGATDDLEKSGQRSVITLGKLGAVTGAFVTGSVLKAGLAYESLKQSSTIALTTMLGSTQAAKREMDDIMALAKQTPFAFPDLLEAGQHMIAFGMAAEKVVPTLKAVGDATAGLGGGNEKLGQISDAIGTIQAKGKLSAHEILRLAQAGVPALQILANQAGVTGAAMSKMITQGEISSEEAIAGIVRGLEEGTNGLAGQTAKFGGLMEGLKSTWQGTVDSFKSSARRAGGEIVRPLMEPLQAGMTGFSAFMNVEGPRLGALFGNAAKGAGVLATGVGGVVGVLGKIPGVTSGGVLALGAVFLASSRLNSIIPAMTARWGTFATQMRVFQAAGTMTGASVTRLGAAAQVAGMRVAAAGRSMMAAFGGPIGIAIIAGVTALSLWSNQSAKAKQAAEAHKQAVDELSQSLDVNTLTLDANGKASNVHYLATTKVAGSGKTVIEMLDGIGVSSTTATAALNGNADAMDSMARQIQASNLSDTQKVFLLGTLTEKYSAFGDAVKNTVAETKIAVTDAASSVGVSAGKVQAAYETWSNSKGVVSLTDALAAQGFTADETSKIMQSLSSTMQRAGASTAGLMDDQYGLAGSLESVADAAAKVRAAMASSVASFVSPVGAYDAVVSRKKAVAGGGGGSAAKPKVSDDPLVKATSTAVTMYARQRKAIDAVAKQAEKDAKKFEKAEKSKADAAKKTADALAKAAQETEKALTEAQDRKSVADRNARDAANILAATQAQQLRAGTSDLESWSRAVQLAATADAAAKTEQISATAALDQAQAAATDTAAKSAAATVLNEAAQARSTAATERAAAATERAAAIQEQTAARYQALLDAKNVAEDKARASTEAMATGASGAASGMVEDVKVSFREWMDELRKQVKDQAEWADNMKALAGRISPEFYDALVGLGPAAAEIVAEMRNQTDAELKEAGVLWGQSTYEAGDKIAEGLRKRQGLLVAVAGQLGTAAAVKLGQALKDDESVDRAMLALKAKVGDDPLNVTLGLANKSEFETMLNRLINQDWVLKMGFTAEVGKQQAASAAQGNLGKPTGRANGGWIFGGSGTKDDVPIMGMGGEFVVNKRASSKWASLLETINGGGQPLPSMLPQPLPSSSSPVINLSSPAAGGGNNYDIKVYQQPGQSAAGLVAEIDRRAPLADVR